jgi:hypothetical protein
MPITDQEKHQSTEEAILRAIRTLGSGSVEVTVQDSKVVQVKVQFSKSRPAKPMDSGMNVAIWP